MPDSTNTQLAPLIERARKVLQYEQRGNHQDRVVKGGLELFVVRWADEVSAVCKHVGLDPKPIYRFTEHLEGYRRQDPMQRAASLRAALVILNELESNGQGDNADSFSSSRREGAEESGRTATTGRQQRSSLQVTAPEMGEDTQEESTNDR